MGVLGSEMTRSGHTSVLVGLASRGWIDTGSSDAPRAAVAVQAGPTTVSSPVCPVGSRRSAPSATTLGAHSMPLGCSYSPTRPPCSCPPCSYPPLTSAARGVSRGDKAGVVASDALTAASAKGNAPDESTHDASSAGVSSPGVSSPGATSRGALVAIALAASACPSRGAGSRCGCGRATPAFGGASWPAAAVACSSCRSCCEAFASIFARARMRLR